MAIDIEESERQAQLAFDFIHAHPGSVELRPTDEQGRILSGYYTNRRQLIHDVGDFIGRSMYWTINEITPNGQVTNRLGPALKGGCTGKKNICTIRNIFIDADSVRPKDVPATEAEHEATLTVVRSVEAYLRGQGFPQGLLASSGNGHYYFLATDLPPSLEPLVKSFIDHVAKRFTTREVTIDTSVWTLEQLARVPGSWNRKKGSCSAERPFRMCQVLSVPPQRQLVTREMLARIAPVQVADIADPFDDYHAEVKREMDWLTARNQKFVVEPHRDEHGEYTILRLAICPFKSGEHDDGRTWLQIHPAKGIHAGCFHAKCQGKGLAAFRKAVGACEEFLGDGNMRAEDVREALTDPHRLAHKHRLAWMHNGQFTSVNIRESLLVWNKGVYREVTDKEMTPFITATIKEDFDDYAQRLRGKGRKGTSAKVSRKIVGDTLNALKSVSRFDTDQQPPLWLVDDPWLANDVIPFENGLLSLSRYLDGKADAFRPLTPAFFNRHKLAFDYDPEAPQPKRWCKFLKELWDDPQCHDLLHEFGGYCMTRDTSLQKMLMLIGEKRGGKGTICWLLGEMVGGNFAAPQFRSLTGEFGLAPLLGKQLALLPDTRKLADRLLAEACEVLKGITGEDPVTINIKNRQQVTEQLRLKVVIQSNDLLAIPDNSSALQARQLFLHFTRSFVGREDFDLRNKLRPELPGIANLFLDGLRRLRANGSVFTEPKSSKALAAEVLNAAVPLHAFIQERCVLDPDWATPTATLYRHYYEWAGENEMQPLESGEFGKQLREVARSVSRSQNVQKYRTVKDTSKANAPKRPYYYIGIRPKADTPAKKAGGRAAAKDAVSRAAKATAKRKRQMRRARKGIMAV